MPDQRDVRTLHQGALLHADQLVAEVGADSWSASTPCLEWTVLDIVNHLVTGNLWVDRLGHGLSIEQVGTELDGDVLGADPIAAHSASVTAAITAFGAPDAMERLWPLSFGPRPGRVYARQRFIDVLIHGWDIAVATGQDTRLPEELVTACLSYVDGNPQLRAAWGFATLDPPASTRPQDRLLALTGRRAVPG